MSKRKLKIAIWETVKYQREATVETDMSEDEFNNLLDRAERVNHHPEDAIFDLENAGVKVIKSVDGDYSSPVDAEIEIVDYAEVENE